MTKTGVPTSDHAWAATNLWTKTPPDTGLATICGKHYGLSWQNGRKKAVDKETKVCMIGDNSVVSNV
jgi:hypothetical protein